MQQKKVEQQVNNKHFTYLDLINSDKHRYETSFGEMILSVKPSASAFSFTKASRNSEKKIFHNEEMAQIDCWGKQGQGPASYFKQKNQSNNFKYTKDPEWKYMSFQEFRKKAQIDKQKDHCPYEYYRLLEDSKTMDIDEADKLRRAGSAKVIFGTQNRFYSPLGNQRSPGPDYQVSIRPETAVAPSFSFGFKRNCKGSDPLAIMSSTNNRVGPGTYFQTQKKQQSNEIIKIPRTSKQKYSQKYSIGRAKRFITPRPVDRQQTYDIKHKTLMNNYDFNYEGGKGTFNSAPINPRSASRHPQLKNKMLSYSFGKSLRNNVQGFFKSSMSTQHMKVNLKIPKF